MLTVLFSTHNGEDTLPTTLDRLEELHAPRGGWKLVVVDNNSSDGTAELIESYADRLPVTCRFEARQGKNFALNSAIEDLEGDLAVFTDDDVRPAKDWLVALRTAAEEHPDFDVFAGRIEPSWPPECPEPLKLLPYRILASAYAVTWPHLECGEISHGLAFGPNVAIRKRFFDQGYRFDTAIGPKGRDYAMGSESELLGRLARAGARTWYCPKAAVEHLIKTEQTSTNWLMGRARRQGRGNCWLTRQRGDLPGPRVLGAPRWLWRQTATSYLRGLAAWLRGDRTSALSLLYQANIHRGYIREARKGAR